MDSNSNKHMKVPILHTEGKGVFLEGTYDVPELLPTQIRVKSIYTGICRSDIDMMNGSFGPLPLHMQGHEGLGQVIDRGVDVTDVHPGDLVATRGEPAYADIYNADRETYVQVPERNPKYIIEPVACGLNVVSQSKEEIFKRNKHNSRLCIIGSGFLSWIVYQYIKNHNEILFDIDVIGNHNQHLWQNNLKPCPDGKYDVIIDINSRDEIFTQDIMNPECLIVMAAEKNKGITTKFSNLLWNAVTVIFPSPRHHGFYQCMKNAVAMIYNNQLDITGFWTKGYDRKTEWENAFEESNQRIPGFNRGYIEWY